MTEENAVVQGRRRDRRDGAEASALPAAPPVQSVKSRSRRVSGGWPMWTGVLAAVTGVVVIAAATLFPRHVEDGPAHYVAASQSTGQSEEAVPTVPCPVFGGGESSSTTRSEACGRLSVVDRTDAESDAVIETDDPGSGERESTESGTGNPDTSSPGSSEPGGSESGTTNPGAGEPGTTTPGTTTPPVTTPTTPPVTTPPVTTPTTPPAATPAGLKFLDLTANWGPKILGIALLSSYTLTLSGEPGSSATVWYGSWQAGTASFSSDGTATITVGQSLIDLGLSNPTIRAAYSDGTAGAEISAKRDSI